MRCNGRLKFEIMAQISTFQVNAVKRLPIPNVAGEAAAGEWTDVDGRPHFIRRTAPKSKVSANACQLRSHFVTNCFKKLKVPQDWISMSTLPSQAVSCMVESRTGGDLFVECFAFSITRRESTHDQRHP
jgi:hypothetical protein